MAIELDSFQSPEKALNSSIQIPYGALTITPVNRSLTFNVGKNYAGQKEDHSHGGAWVIKVHLFLQIRSKLAEKFPNFHTFSIPPLLLTDSC